MTQKPRARVVHAAAVAAVVLGVALGYAPAAAASSFSVNPTQIYLSSSNQTRLVTVTNESASVLRFQVTAFKWDQDERGQMQLTPTQDIVFFPALLTLKPKEERRVRVGMTTTAGESEKTYRIFVEELPQDEPDATTTGVTVLTKMGIPIFLQPARATATATLRNVAMSGETVRFELANLGNVHFLAQTIRVRGFAADGRAVGDMEQNGWYVLAGGARAYAVTLPRPACTLMTSLVVDVRIGDTTLTERLQTSPAACAP